MKAQLWTYSNEVVSDVHNIEISDNYDGDPYGDTIDFAVGSNQAIITDPDLFKEETE